MRKKFFNLGTRFVLAAMACMAVFMFYGCESSRLPNDDKGNVSIVINVNGNEYKFYFNDDGDLILSGSAEDACVKVEAGDYGECLGEMNANLLFTDCNNNFKDDPATCPKTWTQCSAVTSTCSVCIYPAGAGHPAATEYYDGIDNDCDGKLLPDECNADNECPGQICKDHKCQGCNVDMDCADEKFCEPVSKTCQNVVCTPTDVCDANTVANHQCVHMKKPDCCLTNNDCDADKQCNAANACEVVPCAATEQCRIATVENHVCVIKDKVGPCDDGDDCTVDDECKSGVCEPGPDKDCDDSDVCTTDSCDVMTGDCKYTAIAGCCKVDADCADTKACTNNTCTDVPCTPQDACHTAAVIGHVCVQTIVAGCCLADADCGVGGVCLCQNGNWECSGSPWLCVSNACVPTVTSISCDDNNACTTDSCDIVTGCKHVAIPGCCYNDNECQTSKPVNLPSYMLWGCTKEDGTAGTCVSCEDDGDGICQNKEFICNDSWDGDGDGKVDCTDSDCVAAANCLICDPSCGTGEVCDAGFCVPTGTQVWCWDDTLAGQSLPSCFQYGVGYSSPNLWKYFYFLVAPPACKKSDPGAPNKYPSPKCCISTFEYITVGYCYGGATFNPYAP